jgi:THO complex subunit 2
VENYSNQIEPVADALKYLTPFAFDVLTFVVLSRLTSGRDRVKEDGVNISDWLQNLAAFNAAVSK